MEEKNGNYYLSYKNLNLDIKENEKKNWSIVYLLKLMGFFLEISKVFKLKMKKKI